jgi:hypothetical protein
MKRQYFFVLVTLMTLPALSVGLIQPAEAKPVTAGEATRVAIDGRDVTITVPIDAAVDDRATATRWKNDAEQVWNAAFNGPANPYKKINCLNLNLVVDIKVVGFDPKPREHRHKVIEVHDTTGTMKSGGEIERGECPDPWKIPCVGLFKEGFGDFTVASDLGDETTKHNPAHVAHEVGHLLGFHDDYAEVTTQPTRETTPLRCRYHTLMADGGPPDCVLIVQLVERIFNLKPELRQYFPDDCRKVKESDCPCWQPGCAKPEKGEIDFLADSLAFDKLAWGTYTGMITSRLEKTVRSNRGATATQTEDWTIALKFWSQCGPPGCRKTPFMIRPTKTQRLFFGERAQGRYSYTGAIPRAVDVGTAQEHFETDHYDISGPVTAARGNFWPKDSQYEYIVTEQVGYPTGGSAKLYPPNQELEDKGVDGPAHTLKHFSGDTFTDQGGHVVAIHPAGGAHDEMANCATALVGSNSTPVLDAATNAKIGTITTRWQFAYTPLDPQEWPEWERYLPKLDDGTMPGNMRKQVKNALDQFYQDLFSKKQFARHTQLEEYRNRMKLFQNPDFNKQWGPVSGDPGGLGEKMTMLHNEAHGAWQDSGDDKTYQNLLRQLLAARESFTDYRHSLEKLYADEIDQLAAQIQGPEAQTLRALAQQLRTQGIESFAQR